MKEEKVKIKNSIGQNITAIIHYPQKETRKLAILCPGFLDSKDYSHLILLAEELVKKDFTVVRFDPTGTWESEGLISNYNTTQYLKDIKNVKEYMFKKKNYNFILLGGHSLGGRVSLFYASTDSDISVVLAIMSNYHKAPNPNKEEKWKTDGIKINNRDLPDDIDKNKEYLTPYSFIQDSAKYNVLDIIKGLHIPIIFIAGEKDTLCPSSVVKTIFDKANEPKKFIILPNIGHDYRKNISEIKIVNNAIIKLLEEL